MILLDTHIWVWWVQGDPLLGEGGLAALDRQASEGIGVSVFSCWEVAMLHARGRLTLPCSLDEWIKAALVYPGVELVNLTAQIAIESCRLPGEFHRDPADRILVATARGLSCRFVTADEKILAYPHVRALHPEGLALA
ncbi:MAG TPA: type II toxin-antitoxin system VapC family toxin [Candidatus Hydrogenedentes bacterium]|nr:type II toxin-antitoxin system VapC family toxin [Candidatus Hydrogenedentota bacterium]HIJ74726.1 type II toxin-antitoxin system VapC family toxin [Candidatus Hydrogenedentota bacterium]